MKKKTLFFVLLLIACLSFHHSFSFAETTDSTAPNILVISSYNRDLMHTVMVEEGIVEEIQKEYPSANFRYEYLDAKHYTPAEYYPIISQILKSKYANDHFDAIITVDNDALELMLHHRDDYFDNQPPVIATAVNGVDDIIDKYDSQIQSDHYYIIEEKPDYAKSIEISLKQNKSVDHLYFIIDSTATSAKIKNEIIAVKSQFPDLSFTIWEDLSPEDLVKKTAHLTQNDSLFYVTYFHPPKESDELFNYVSLVRDLESVSPVPLYSFWDLYINDGIVGGYLISSKSYGEKAAEITINLLNEEVEPVYHFEDGKSIQYVFNYHELQKYHIDYIPKSSLVVNAPVSFIQKNKEILIVSGAIVGALILIIILLIIVLRNNTKLSHYNAHINRLNSDIISTQREFIVILGEVIETRSKETANHVVRVAKISGLLGQLYGLSEEEVRTLEMVSPLHDVGKIGIPDAILNKPGRLSTEEYKIAQTHASIGYNILKGTGKEIMKNAAIIAFEHHEKWDGTGYPNQLKGDQIHIYAQITCLADIYDALIHKRVYKEAWTEKAVLQFIESESGKTFNPQLVKLFLEHYDSFNQIRLSYNDEDAVSNII